MKLGYARVSTDDQDMLMQIEALKAAGVKEENIYKEHVSGMKKDRPELKRMLDFTRVQIHLKEYEKKSRTA